MQVQRARHVSVETVSELPQTGRNCPPKSVPNWSYAILQTSPAWTGTPHPTAPEFSLLRSIFQQTLSPSGRLPGARVHLICSFQASFSIPQHSCMPLKVRTPPSNEGGLALHSLPPGSPGAKRIGAYFPASRRRAHSAEVSG